MGSIKVSNTLFQVMMFLEYAIWGAWYVTLGAYLGQTLQFTGTQIGLVYGAFAVAAMISPILIGTVADYLLPAKKVLAILHLIGVLLLVFIANQDEYTGVYALVLIYALCYMPTIALTNSITMEHLPNPESEFPRIRVLGTVGWIAIGWVVSTLKLEVTHYPMYIAAGLSCLMVVVSVFLPEAKARKTHTQLPPLGKMLGLDALSLLKDRAFLVLMLCSLATSIPLSFYYGFTNLFMNDSGIEYAAAKMTLGQVSEIVCMLLLPFFFRRWGAKYVILVAILAWAARYLFFAFSAEAFYPWMLMGILLHGICYDFFFVASQIYVNNYAPKHLINSAQGLLTQMTYGVGMFLGTLLSGIVVSHFSTDAGYDWQAIWLVPACISIVVALFFWKFFLQQQENID
ncbi:MFS transporter [Teredinibacter sp. KSP-S5-2]|uniref:MFS transporter n=1 Tax=Teredinibacter sp. KSP-S5-2 TaxID=3034506 RepID=UPI0029341BC6|nr:MFS transporter [Teredinibacter sp. KSP-S5-2]WNO11311.1 MFS transporter [Teredinibacter sp. KSP-S5-2]